MLWLLNPLIIRFSRWSFFFEQAVSLGSISFWRGLGFFRLYSLRRVVSWFGRVWSLVTFLLFRRVAFSFDFSFGFVSFPSFYQWLVVQGLRRGCLFSILFLLGGSPVVPSGSLTSPRQPHSFVLFRLSFLRLGLPVVQLGQVFRQQSLHCSRVQSWRWRGLTLRAPDDWESARF